MQEAMHLPDEESHEEGIEVQEHGLGQFRAVEHPLPVEQSPAAQHATATRHPARMDKGVKRQNKEEEKKPKL